MIHEFVSDRNAGAVACRHIATMDMKDGGVSEFEGFVIGQVDSEGRFERVVESIRKVRARRRMRIWDVKHEPIMCLLSPGS